MKIGVNWLTSHSYPVVRRLLDEGVADFCEIMVDNAIHLSPEKILAAFPGIPLALHIVSSHFVTKSTNELQEMARHLRPWIAALSPIYTSDHLPPLNYQIGYGLTCARVTLWQELLGVRLLLENSASMNEEDVGQAAFYFKLIQEAKCELLFDFSNAYIAQHNKVEIFTRWELLISRSQHFHIGGFQINPRTNLAHDTHTIPIANEALALLKASMEKNNLSNATLVVEFNTHDDYQTVRQQLLEIKSRINNNTCDLVWGEIQRPAVSSINTNKDIEGVKDQLIKAVTDWALNGLEHISAKGIMVRSQHDAGLAVGLWKNSEPHQPSKITILNISALNLLPADAYAISYQANSWENLQWLPLDNH